MKPILIYSLPRTRSTATLASAKRADKLDEPFRIDHVEFMNIPFDERARRANQPDSATKVFGWHLASLPPARKWFERALETHETFVLVRDLREVCLSYCLGSVYGWHKHSEFQNPERRVSEQTFGRAAYQIDQFLRFFPTGKPIVRFKTLPEEFFDKSLNTTIKDQNLHSRLSEIENLDEVYERVDRIIELYGPEWNEKVV